MTPAVSALPTENLDACPILLVGLVDDFFQRLPSIISHFTHTHTHTHIMKTSQERPLLNVQWFSELIILVLNDHHKNAL
jgi:hypothetical protein